MQTKLTANFDLNEFSCPCCGLLPDYNTAFKLAVHLQNIRDDLGEALVITSALRCVPHNQQVGGVNNSLHLSGNAVDFYCADDNVSACVLAMLAYREGFRSIGIGDDWIHVDMRNFGSSYDKSIIWHY